MGRSQIENFADQALGMLSWERWAASQPGYDQEKPYFRGIKKDRKFDLPKSIQVILRILWVFPVLGNMTRR